MVRVLPSSSSSLPSLGSRNNSVPLAALEREKAEPNLRLQGLSTQRGASRTVGGPGYHWAASNFGPSSLQRPCQVPPTPMSWSDSGRRYKGCKTGWQVPPALPSLTQAPSGRRLRFLNLLE